MRSLILSSLSRPASIRCRCYSTRPLLEENDVPHLTGAFMPRAGKVTLVMRLRANHFKEIFPRGVRSFTRKCSAPSNSGRAPLFMPWEMALQVRSRVFPEALMTTTMTYTLTKLVIYFANNRVELSIMASGGSWLSDNFSCECLQHLFCITLTHYVSQCRRTANESRTRVIRKGLVLMIVMLMSYNFRS